MTGLDQAYDWRELRANSGDRLKAELVAHLVAVATGVPAKEVFNTKKRANAVVRARHISMYLAHTGLGWPLERVGAAFRRDRTSVSNACKRVEDWRSAEVFDQQLADLEACLRVAPDTPSERGL